MEGLHVGVDNHVDILHLRQHLQTRLRLRRLAGLGAEAVDEGLKVPAFLLLLLDQLVLQRLLLDADLTA